MYYEQAQDREKELRCMNKAKTLFDELNDWNWVQRGDNLAGVIYDFEGISRNALLVPDAFADVKILYSKTDYPDNIISNAKYEFMIKNPDKVFYFVTYWYHLKVFKCRQILKEHCKFVKDFRVLHTRATKLNGKPTYDVSDVYFLSSPVKIVNINT